MHMEKVRVYMPAARGWNVLDVYCFRFFCIHSSFFQKQHPNFILGNCPSPTLGPCVTSVGVCLGQLAYFICPATTIGLGKGSTRPIWVNIGIFFLNYCERGSVFLLGLLSFSKINLELPETTTWSQTVHGNEGVAEKNKNKRETESS